MRLTSEGHSHPLILCHDELSQIKPNILINDGCRPLSLSLHLRKHLASSLEREKGRGRIVASAGGLVKWRVKVRVRVIEELLYNKGVIGVIGYDRDPL